MEPTVARPTRTERSELLTMLLLAVLVAGTIVFLWRSSDAEEIYLSVHVIAVVVWVGGGASLTILALLTQRARDPHALANLVRQIETMAMRIFTPASLVTLGFGFALVEKQGIGYGSFWIDFALAVWALSFVLGAGLIGPRTAKLRRLIDERGEDDPGVEQGIATVLLLARVDVTMLLLVVIAMCAKPTF
jgi:uncharacterized membrane protein